MVQFYTHIGHMVQQHTFSIILISVLNLHIDHVLFIFTYTQWLLCTGSSLEETVPLVDSVLRVKWRQMAQAL